MVTADGHTIVQDLYHIKFILIDDLNDEERRDTVITFARGATPVITFELDGEDLDEDLDLTRAKNIYITFSHKNGVMTKQPDADGVLAQSVTVTLSQKDTLSLPEGKVRMQINWTFNGGIRWNTDCEECLITPQLLNKVVG